MATDKKMKKDKKRSGSVASGSAKKSKKRASSVQSAGSSKAKGSKKEKNQEIVAMALTGEKKKKKKKSKRAGSTASASASSSGSKGGEVAAMGSVKSGKSKKSKKNKKAGSDAGAESEKKSKKSKKAKGESAHMGDSEDANKAGPVADPQAGHSIPAEGDTVPINGFGPYQNKDRQEAPRGGVVRTGGVACQHVGGRQQVGGPEFQARAEEYRRRALANKEKRAEGRERCKKAVQDQLKVVLDFAKIGLDKCRNYQLGKSKLAADMLAAVTKVSETFTGLNDKDQWYQEEVRYKHMKMSDCLDETRAFEPAALQRDLVRNRDIRARCSALIRGAGADDDFEINEAELDELVRVRNTIKTWYGGQNTMKGIAYDPMSSANGKALSTMLPSEIHAGPEHRIEKELKMIEGM